MEINKYKIGDLVVPIKRPKDVEDCDYYDKFIKKVGEVSQNDPNDITGAGQFMRVYIKQFEKNIAYWEDDVIPASKIERILYG